MSNNALFTIEQVDDKLIITVEAVKPEHPNPTMIRSNDGNMETVEFVNPPLTINTNRIKPEQHDLPETRPMNADEIGQWAANKFNLSTYDEINLRNYILNLVDYELNKAKR